MAVTFDAVGPSSAGTAAAGASSLSWSHTCGSGTTRCLIVVVAVGRGDETTVSLGVTYNSVAMTSIAKVHSNNDVAGFVEMFKLVAPTSGANTVAVTVTGPTCDLEGGSVSFDGVDQTTPTQNVTTAFGSSATPSVNVTSAAGNMVVDGSVCGVAFTASGQTNRWTKNQNTSTAGGNAASSTADGAGTVTMSYATNNDWWGIIGADIKADGGGGGGGTLGAGTPYYYTMMNHWQEAA